MAKSEIEKSSPDEEQLDGDSSDLQISVESHQFYQGSLPLASEFAKYEETLPGVAQTIVDMAQKEQAFRHEATRHGQETERIVLRHTAAKTYLGQIGAFVITTTTLCGSFWLINNGHSAAGIAGIVTALTALATVFVFGKRSESNEEPEPDDSDSE